MSETEDQVRDLTRRWAAAEVAADTTALDALACPDFRLVGPAGFVLDKQQWLERYRSGALVTTSLTFDDLDTRACGPAGEASAVQRDAAAPPELDNMPSSATSYLATGASTGGQFGLYRWDFGPRRSGPDPHFHKAVSESFFILSGTVSLHDGRAWTVATEGSFLYVPPGGIHASATTARSNSA